MTTVPEASKRSPGGVPEQTRVGILSWDWREQPDTNDLAELLAELTNGLLHVTVVDTGSDQHAIAISTAAITSDEASDAYDKYWFGEDS